MATFALKSIADIGRNMMQQAASKMASAKKAEGEQKGDESGSKRRKAEKAVKAGKAEPSKGSEKAAESGGNSSGGDKFEFRNGGGGSDPQFPNLSKSENALLDKDPVLNNTCGEEIKMDGVLNNGYAKITGKKFANILCKGENESLEDYTRRFNILSKEENGLIRFDSDKANNIFKRLDKLRLDKIKNYILNNDDEFSNKIFNI